MSRRDLAHWADYRDIVLPPADVVRCCQAAGASLHRATVAGRCLVIRVDDAGIARRELADCNGWKHPKRGGTPPAPLTRPKGTWVHTADPWPFFPAINMRI